MLKIALAALFLVLATPALAATQLPLSGSKLAGSVTFNAYNYYYFTSSQSGNVIITTTITGGSEYGAWTYVGAGYDPIDGNSDWEDGMFNRHARACGLLYAFMRKNF
jgi:hypothetical protein